MLNKYPLWKNILIALIVVISSIVALPNLFGEDPSVQISPTRTTQIDDVLVARVEKVLAEANLPKKRIDRSEDRLLVRFLDAEDQLKAKDLIDKALGRDFNTALNQSSDTPQFLTNLGLNPMYLGLDLRGGVHFLMEVDMNSVIEQMADSYADDIRVLLRDKSITTSSVNREKDFSIKVDFADGDVLRSAQSVINQDPSLRNLTWQVSGNQLVGRISETEITERRTNAVQQNITTLRNRVNELGVAEPNIAQQGPDRIVVQLPGVQDTAKAKQILGSTATLEFRMVDERSVSQAAAAAQSGRAPLGTKLFHMRDTQEPILLKRQVILTGESIVNASAGQDQNGMAQVDITLDSRGAEKFSAATKVNIDKPMATVFIESRVEIVDVDGVPTRKNITTEEVVNVATIRAQLFKKFQISGMGSAKDASDLAVLLRAGALAAPIQIVEERTVGPSAGKENIKKGFEAATMGLVLIMIFMVVRYRAFGMIANVALVVNLIMIVALLSMLQATLTLPGIAGIVLSLGMSVDANVLIYERIREDLKKGLSPQHAIDAGFKRAFDTIMDANLTSLIAAVVLFGIGSGPIKGFAITLSLGIITSLFTAVMLARAIVNIIYGGRKLKGLSIGSRELIPFLSNNTNFDFMKGRKIYVSSCAVVIVIASVLVGVKGFNYGLDFTGGSVIELAYTNPVEIETVKQDLIAANIENAQVQYFGSSRDVMIRLPVKSIELAVQGSADSQQNSAAAFSTKILEAVRHEGNPVDIRRVEFVGSQVGQELVMGGIMASALAILGILIYIWVRFEWKLAVGTILSTVHDTFFVIGVFVVLRLEFDLTALAAILAVIGYSVNDTVVVLDRIRENFRSARRGTPIEIVNSAINQTMSRTIMTSLTTFLAVLALYLFGGSAVESFSLAMLVGVVVGTYSSIFIAAAGAIMLGLTKEDLMPPKKEVLEEGEGYGEGYGTRSATIEPDPSDFIEGEAREITIKKK